ncbi:hypothetical protein [Pelagicoccus sp. SDUM812003]|uniref:hypothetical protein n=1 Tax=Pelagicoccus sp. SDUM812003 TaxID=3041267 RepID=UPI0028106C82|nr:hypothetical protein [Pelagicoccus sp. SDUM812003]MDQ8202896.1 hypothetical protein [Pelagicoccus sp. SDUM812003]
MLPLKPSRIAVFILLVAASLVALHGRASIFSSPETDDYFTDDGTVPLAWAATTEGDEFEVRRWQAGGDPQGVLVYQGGDTASFLSGLPEGVFEIRVRSRGQGEPFPEWEDAHLRVTVDYKDMRVVAALMGAGFLTFIAIVATIVVGHRRALREAAK